jgi:hypothetical protein
MALAGAITPDSDKTNGNQRRGTACRNTDEFPVSVAPAIIGGFAATAEYVRVRQEQAGRESANSPKAARRLKSRRDRMASELFLDGFSHRRRTFVLNAEPLMANRVDRWRSSGPPLSIHDLLAGEG